MNDESSPASGDVSRETPLEITTFYPQPIDVLVPPHGRAAGRYSPRNSVRSNRRVALVLFLATCVSVFLAGLSPGLGFLTAAERLDVAYQHGEFSTVWHTMAREGAAYFGALMAILIAHEMGHFLQARRYRVPATVPYFIPFPISPIGTMGAVIIQGAGVANRKSLYDIAISGPLAGLVFAIPITIIGIRQADIQYADPIYGEPLVMEWLIRWFHGPIPEHFSLGFNALRFAGWVGIFITALNLVPIGQLDGGHILYTLVGRAAHWVAMVLLVAAVGFMVMQQHYSYILIVLLLFFTGPRHPPTADDSIPLGTGRIILGWLTLAFVIIGFTPIPITTSAETQRPYDKRTISSVAWSPDGRQIAAAGIDELKIWDASIGCRLAHASRKK